MVSFLRVAYPYLDSPRGLWIDSYRNRHVLKDVTNPKFLQECIVIVEGSIGIINSYPKPVVDKVMPWAMSKLAELSDEINIHNNKKIS